MSHRFWENKPYKLARKLVIAILGFSVIVIGAGMLFLPGPAILVIPAGLAMLATEFRWARRLLRRLRDAAGWNSSSAKSSAPPPRKEKDDR